MIESTQMNIETIISKYLNKSTSEDENEHLLRWLEGDDENKIKFKNIYDIWLFTNASLTEDGEVEVALNRLKERVSFPTNRKRYLVTPRYLMQIAVSLLLLLSAAYLGYKTGENKELKMLTYNHLLTGSNGKGEYLLPDGSTVWLNSNSILKYPETFTKGKRVVYLEGEALFEIEKDMENPFVVETGGVNIEVTGTCFLVHNYAEKNIIETVLVNGAVTLSGDYFTKPFKMSPGELITYNKNTHQTELHQVNADDYINWVHSKLVFDKTNLAQIVIGLEKWFNVEIEVDQELVKSTHMSFTVRRESIEDVLTYMSLTAPIDYKWEEGILYLSIKNKK